MGGEFEVISDKASQTWRINGTETSLPVLSVPHGRDRER